MGLFNTLVHDTTCHHCGNVYKSKSQFKYGDLWDYEYVFGERIRLRPEDDRHGTVIASLFANSCPSCGEWSEGQLMLVDGVPIRELASDEFVDLGHGEWIEVRDR